MTDPETHTFFTGLTYVGAMSNSEDLDSVAKTTDDGPTTVLVVDDETVVRESFSLYLEPLGYEGPH